MFVLIFRLCVMCFLPLVLVRCLFDLGQKNSFEQEQNQSMTLASSTLQIWRQYSRDLYIIIFVDIGALPFYVINMDVVKIQPFYF
jgi:hypothetical protein